MATKSQKRKAVKAAEKAIKKSPKWVIITAIILVVVIVGGYFIYTKFFKKSKPLTGELTFHFMMLGNANAGDCEEYYTASDTLQIRPGTIRDRHEIDCLLRFAFRDNNKMPFGFDDMPGYEPAFLAASAGLGNMPEVITTVNGRIVGWAYTPLNGKRQIQLHWHYKQDNIQ